MKSFLDAEVSLFNNVKSKLPLKTITLREWLFRDNSDLRKKVDDIRTSEGEEKRDLKESIFCITGSGIFSNGRSDEKIVKHNGNIIIDIDYKDNTDLDNFHNLKEDLFSKIPQIRYAGTSVGGKGYFVIIGIENPDKHKLYFEFIRVWFKNNFKLVIDKNCINISRLRLFSYDDNPYINESASILNQYNKPTKIKYKAPLYTSNSTDKIEDLVRKIEMSGISIAPSYEEYLKLAVVFYTECGESGRNYYHRVCRTDPKYSESHCDSQFNEIIKAGYNRCTIGSLKHFMRVYGVI